VERSPSRPATPICQSKYNAWARECYKKAPPLRGPNGEILRIKLAVDNPGVPAPDQREIKIVADKPGERADAGKWREKMDCPAVLHETLHILGLIDEYEETAKGVVVTAEGEVKDVETGATKTTFDCRVLGPVDSVMWGQTAAYDACKPGTLLDLCRCTATTPAACHKEMQAQAAGAACPPERRSVDRQVNPASAGWKGFTVSFGPTNQFYVMHAFPQPPKRTSLLYPAEFRAIVQPQCVAGNKTYAACAKEAYVTSRGNYGQGKCSTALPAACTRGGPEWLK
jgi:hypothetical protein